MLNICICEDNSLILEKNRSIIKQLLVTNNIQHLVTAYDSAESLLFNLYEMLNSIDIMILDIELVNMNGLELAQELRKRNFVGVIIFLTSHADYVFESFDVGASHYFMKNSVDTPKFKSSFIKIVNGLSTKNDTFYSYEIGGRIRRINVRDIMYFEVNNRKIDLHTKNSIETFYSTITKIEERVNSLNFGRAHRSFIVNMLHIKEFNNSYVTLSNGTEIPVGKKYVNNLRDSFVDFIQK